MGFKKVISPVIIVCFIIWTFFCLDPRKVHCLASTFKHISGAESDLLHLHITMFLA